MPFYRATFEVNAPAPVAAGRDCVRNRVLSPTNGRSALARFDRDVLMQPGVTHVVLLEGINDLSRGTAARNPRDSVAVADIVFGYQQLIARAHHRGLIIYGGRSGHRRSSIGQVSSQRTRTSRVEEGRRSSEGAGHPLLAPEQFLL